MKIPSGSSLLKRDYGCLSLISIDFTVDPGLTPVHHAPPLTYEPLDRAVRVDRPAHKNVKGVIMSLTLIEKALVAVGIPKRDRYTLPEANMITGGSIETLRRKLREGALQGQRIGRKWLFIYYDDLAKLLDKDSK